MMKPLVYIASPYTQGDPAVNVHFQHKMFDELLRSGLVTPLSPLWTHYQHIMSPHPASVWYKYDHEVMKRCDACLRLEAIVELNGGELYRQNESTGADEEVRLFKKWGKPVFYWTHELLAWAEKTIKEEKWND